MRRFIYYHLTRQDLLAIDKICQFVAFGDDVDLILLARELVSKQAARKMVLKIEVIRGDSARNGRILGIWLTALQITPGLQPSFPYWLMHPVPPLAVKPPYRKVVTRKSLDGEYERSGRHYFLP